ncbi:hypothetical protein BGZ70_008383 [Mortierella alpina]|uniref:Uncharacterized protein n=1 Tax=Mortierella alpina TaxID=64518 RepID=A0A9P6J3K8_MORAP|nr:hypothetical protein BGZ70_008383 [Mortierella alpina]
MDDLSEGCYCAQAQTCPHWIASKMDNRLSTAKEHVHERTKTFEQERLQEDHRPIVSDLQRELRTAMLEIENLAKTSRDLARVNQELDESRLLAISDQIRTTKRLTLVSSQLEYTEQQLFDITKNMDDGQKDSDLLRIERIKRETLQEREDASRLKIESLQDELQEVQRSERLLQQKLLLMQNKYETLAKRHDNVKRQQQELELARESKEALAWLKETTDRLCSPPKGSLGQAIQHERSSHSSAAISLPRSSPSSSPPYPSSFIDPPLAAQNQLISLIKELATTNSTLRSELNEYRDLLQDTRNEVLSLRSQVEDYEQGHAFEGCCGGRIDDGDSMRTSKSAWSTLDVSMAGGGLDAASHIGTLGSIPGSPPPYMTTTTRSRLHHQFHHTGIRGSVFGELDRIYSQGNHMPAARKGRSHSSKKSKEKSGRGQRRAHGAHGSPSDQDRTAAATTVSTSTSTSDIRRGSGPILNSSRSPPNPMPSRLRDHHLAEESSPTSNTSRSRRSMYTDADMDMLESGSDSGDNHHDGEEDEHPQDAEHSSDEYSGSEHEPGFVAAFAEAENPTAQSLTESALSPSLSRRPPSLLPAADLDHGVQRNEDFSQASMIEPGTQDLSDNDNNSPMKSRAGSISLLSAELQKATRSETNADLPRGDTHPPEEDIVSPLEGRHAGSFSEQRQGTLAGTLEQELAAASWSKPNGRHRLSHHEKSPSDQGMAALRQRRRLSEPLHHQPSFQSLPTKKNRPGSIYSLRRTRPRMDSPDLHCHHSGHMVSASAGCLPELQRYKSAELVEQMITERRQRMMEAWREGVVAAAVAQQQSLHSAGASEGPRADPDNISIRSKASRKYRVSVAKDVGDKVAAMNNGQAGSGVGDIGPGTAMTSPSYPESTIQDTLHADKTLESELGLGIMESSVSQTRDGAGSLEVQQHHLTINTASVQEENKPVETNSLSQDSRSNKQKNRRSVRSMMSIRSSIFRSPLVRSPHLARDRRFPSEASTASEAFSNRRTDYEQSPYQLLHTLSSDLLERLARSDTRELNRRLRRTFDIQALSQMSNSVIENVLTDVNNLNERFRWVEAQVANPTDGMTDQAPATALSGDEANGGSGPEEEDDTCSEQEPVQEPGWDFSVEEFFPLAHTVQEMLCEIGKLRMTINELQLSYVLKVEQDRIKAEKDFRQGVGSEEDEEDEYDSQEDLDPLESSERMQGKSGKGVLRILDRPRILSSASTGVSGFFNKVFGGGANASHETIKPVESSRPAAAKSQFKVKDVFSTTTAATKAVPVAAESSKAFSDSAWISAPGTPAHSRTPGRQATVDGPRISSAGGIIVPGSRLSATTSLSTMANLSPARPSTLQGTDEATTASVASAGSKAIDIGTSPHGKRLTASRSPMTASSMPHSTTQGVYKQASPRFQGGETQRVTFVQSIRSADGGAGLEPEMLDSGAGSGPSTSTNPERDRSPVGSHRPLPSFGLSTRTSGPALNVVTKGDIFQEHSFSPAASSASANAKALASSTIQTGKRPGDDGEAALGAKGSTITTTTSNTTIATSEAQGMSSSMTSLSASSAASEPVSTVASRLVSKPTLIARSALAVATPSTSTVSSPMSAASWFDSRRSSGVLGADAFPAGETGVNESSAASGSGSGRGSGSGSLQSPGHVGEPPATRKTRAVTSFHLGAAAGGSSESATRSLGRASGRESALAYLRGETQSTSVLSSFFQSQPKSPSPSPSRASMGSPVTQATRRSMLKGKGIAWDDYGESSVRPNLEILDRNVEDETAGTENGHRATLDEVDSTDANRQKQLSASRSDTGLLASGSLLSTPAASLPQRAAAVTSTAVAYVVATPDVHGADDREAGARRKRAVFDRDLIMASQKRILAGVPHQDKPFVPEARPRRARALSVDSAQSTEPLKAKEIMDLWRVGAGVSRDLWRGLIKKVDGRDS